MDFLKKIDGRVNASLREKKNMFQKNICKARNFKQINYWILLNIDVLLWHRKKSDLIKENNNNIIKKINA